MGNTSSNEIVEQKDSVVIGENNTEIDNFLKKNEKTSPTIEIKKIGNDATNVIPPSIYKDEFAEILTKFQKIYTVCFRTQLSKANAKKKDGFIWFTLDPEDHEKYLDRIATVFCGKCVQEGLSCFDELKLGLMIMSDRVHVCVYVASPPVEFVEIGSYIHQK